jgi:hypothetical protein
MEGKGNIFFLEEGRQIYFLCRIKRIKMSVAALSATSTTKAGAS